MAIGSIISLVVVHTNVTSKLETSISSLISKLSCEEFFESGIKNTLSPPPPALTVPLAFHFHHHYDL